MKKLCLIIYLFFLLFAPPLIPHVNIIIPMGIFSFVILISKYRSEVSRILVVGKFNRFIILYSVAIVFIIIAMYVGNFYDSVNMMNYITNLYRFLLLCPVCLICILHVIIISQNQKLSQEEFFKILIYVGIIQAIIGISMMLSPNLKSILLNMMFKNSGDILTQNLWTVERRYWGFANNMFDTFGYGTGIIAGLPFFLAYKGDYFKLLFFPILFLVPFVNSRTGLIMIMLGGISCLPLYIRYLKKNIVKLCILLMMMFLVIAVVIFVIGKFYPITSKWVEQGLQGLFGAFSGNASDSVGKLLQKDKWYLPDGWNFMVGTGHNIYQAAGYGHSDVGYINDIWLGGLIGAILLYLPFINLFYNVWESKRDNRYMAFFLAAGFFCFNIKGQVVAYNTGLCVTLLISFFCISNSQKNNEKYSLDSQPKVVKGEELQGGKNY